MGRVYDLQAWKRARIQHLTEEPLCRHCLERGIEKPAKHVDHIKPISEGGEWFDGANLQSLCHDCHNRKTQADEGKNVKLGCAANGMPLDRRHPWNTD